MIRGLCRKLCLRLMEQRVDHDPRGFFEESAVVFSPHYDDETLGVGGTILRKRSSGAAVHLVFMTDGSRSHARVMEGTQLAVVRRQEAIEASQALGVARSQVTFLEFPEGRLAQHAAEAVTRVAALLADLDCNQVFVPSVLEPLIWSTDHRTTTTIVSQALSRSRRESEVIEYLVWFWYHWPWVPFWGDPDVRQILALTWANRFGLAACRSLNLAVDVSESLSQKRAALESYRSQMTRLVKDKPWPVLSDVGGGEFLQRFFHPCEYFRRRPPGVGWAQEQ